MGGMKRDEYTHVCQTKAALSQAEHSLRTARVLNLYIQKLIHSNTLTDTLRSSNNTAHLCQEIKAPPALHPNSPLWTEHLHPTRRYKNRQTRENLNLHLNLWKTRVETPS